MINNISKKPTIGFFVGGRSSKYSDMLCDGAIQAAEECDVNLILFPGRALRPQFYSEYSHFLYGNHYQYNVIYEYATANNLDAIIICSAMLNSFITKEQYRKFCLKYKPLPIVSIAAPIESIPDIPSILIDNKSGFSSCLNHLVRDHGKKKIAFIRGPEKNNEAEERFQVYKEVLKENNIKYNPMLVCPGDFTSYSAEKALKLLIDERQTTFDAIACANDETALSLLKELEKRKINVPNDVCVIGFDDYPESSQSNPTLTTVRQPIIEQAKKAVETAISLIEGKHCPDVMLKTQAIIRESCGCLSEAINCDYSLKPSNLTADQTLTARIVNSASSDINLYNHIFDVPRLQEFISESFISASSIDFDEHEAKELVLLFKGSININLISEFNIIEIQKVISRLRNEICCLESYSKNYTTIEKFFTMLQECVSEMIENFYSGHMLRHENNIQYLRDVLNLIILNIDKGQVQLESIVYQLRKLGLESCYIYLYDNEISNGIDDTWKTPQLLNLVLAYNNEGVIRLEEGDRRIEWEDVLKNNLLPEDRRYTLLFNPLFLSDKQIGLILCELNLSDYQVFEYLATELSCAIKLNNLMKANDEFESELKNSVFELEQFNQILDNISQTDEMTKLFNRRGFLNLATKSLSLSKNMGKSGLLFYIDMDGLKKINDTFGHDEGDRAIRAVADILRKSFRKSNIIARLGGDEFTVLVTDINPDTVELINAKLKKNTDDYNRKSAKPYTLSFSTGIVSFSNNDSKTIEKLLALADSALYAQKKSKTL